MTFPKGKLYLLYIKPNFCFSTSSEAPFFAKKTYTLSKFHQLYAYMHAQSIHNACSKGNNWQELFQIKPPKPQTNLHFFFNFDYDTSSCCRGGSNFISVGRHSSFIMKYCKFQLQKLDNFSNFLVFLCKKNFRHFRRKIFCGQALQTIPATYQAPSDKYAFTF